MARSDRHIILRLFVEVENATEAQKVVDNISTHIKTSGNIYKSDVKRYWKLHQYHEIILDIIPIIDTKNSFMNILSTIASGWETHDSSDGWWAVWNPAPFATSFFDTVRWASIEVI